MAEEESRPDLRTVREQYQVPDDEVIRYRPRAFGAVDVPFTEELEVSVTKTEGRLLDEMTFDRGMLGLNTFHSIYKDAFSRAEAQYPTNPLPAGVPEAKAREWQGNDGHRDAFRHTFWSARLAQEYGADWARAFTTAHEGLPGNPANREAMDLYNNSIGIRIGAEHPDASPGELAALVREAVTQGKSVVIDSTGDLNWSDRVPVGQHGLSPQNSIEPHLKTPQVVPTESAALSPAWKANGEVQFAHAEMSGGLPMGQTLLADSEKHVRQLCDAHQLAWDQGMTNTAAAVAHQAGASGMSGIDRLAVRDGQIHFCQDDGYGMKTGCLDAQVAANTPAESSIRGLEEVERSIGSGQDDPTRQSMAVALEEPARGLSMSA